MSGSARIVTLLFCVLTLVVGVLQGARVAAQSTVVGEATGVSVTLSPEWVLVHEAVNSDESRDYLMFANGNVNVSIVSYAFESPEVSVGLSLIPGDAIINDIESSGTYALYSVDANGRSYGVFSVVVGSEVQTVIAPTSGFAAAIESAQAGIQINGSPAFNGVDGEALAPAITLGDIDASADAELPALVPAVDSTPASDETEGEDPTEDATAVDVTTDAATSEEEAVEDSSAPVDPSETGFVDDHTWVSPQHGTIVTWGDTWEPRSKDDSGNPTFFTIESTDVLCLTSTDAPVEGILCVSARPHNEFIGGQENWNSKYLGPDSMGSYGLPYFAAVVTVDGFVYGDTSLDMQNATVLQGGVNNGVFVETYIRGPLDQLPVVLAPSQAQVTVDGNPAFHLLDVATFTSEAEAMAARAPELVAERDAGLQAMGLVDPNHYTSVATGCDIAWDDALVLEVGTTLHPIIAVPAWIMETGQEVPAESFTLSVSEMWTGLHVTCYADSGAFGGSEWWFDAGYTVIEGEGIRVAVSPDMGGSYELYVVVTSPDDPVLVEIYLYVSTEELEALIESHGPGGLMINGVDVFQGMKDMDLIEQLP